MCENILSACFLIVKQVHTTPPLSSSSFGENSLVKNTKSVLNVKNDTSSGLCVHRGGFIPLKDQVWSLYALAKQQ